MRGEGMIRIRTPSRLHFGLFSLPAAHASAWLNQEGAATLPRRQFGGVGLMIDRPGIDLVVEPGKTWSATGPHAERALRFAQTYCASAGIQEAFRVRIVSAAPEHAGLGTGTQLGLAVARAIAELTGQPARDAVTLARHVGRGLRSALGVHGFDHGGFLVEGGKTTEAAISPLIAHHDFPGEWGVVLVMHGHLRGIHGGREIDAFADLARREHDDRTTETLTRIVLLGMIPALVERDLTTFGEALYDYNRRVGEMFQAAQGGLYAHPELEELIKMARAAGFSAVGQSSWGPAVFVVHDDGPQAISLCDWLSQKKKMQPDEIKSVRACNQGAVIERSVEEPT
jgi:beta-ribofuranosylaminobenzene 5'-phosphate synthase